MTKHVYQELSKAQKDLQFSGSFHACHGEYVMGDAYGFANRAEEIGNQAGTRFAIASGSKIFTAVAICQLVNQGKITFDTRLKDCLDIEWASFDEQITIHHLLTHTSGVPDYFDEDEMDDFEALWDNLPMYKVRRPSDFLPMFQHEGMDGEPGDLFKYNNAGYIILGLIIEQVSGVGFTDYIERHVFHQAGMNDSGFFSMEALPAQTALGYIDNPDGTWRTNVYALPVKGGPDGGAYVTARDMGTFWKALVNGELLPQTMVQTMLKPRALVDDDIYYGYAGYMEVNQDGVVKVIQMGYDPGVNFRAVHYPDKDLTIVVCSNEEEGAYEMLKEIESIMLNS